MSAKTGDSVSQCFYRVAADLSGVSLTRPEMEVVSKIVTAQIVNHPLQDEVEEETNAVRKSEARRASGCSIQ